MEAYLEIFKTRADDLIKISINERKDKGPGMFFLNFTDKEKMDAFYIHFYDRENECINKNFPPELVNYFKDKRESPMFQSTVYFHLFDKDQHLNLELDLDKNNAK